ncbi:glycosyl hydrolase [Pinibacter soli]|uniref:Glycosyl hydrolase n=1 Tax=Pinibacter soli TaxID=3044211 RepID=A0ABT6REI4_9BACT|nr:glycosyl hydrolase [Pinibacter soli]MDI3320938.1 glycosyl hydrolase [Pinibacter soli]
MKMNITLGMLLMILASSCTKSQLISDLPLAKQSGNGSATFTTKKRGAAFSTGTSTGFWADNIKNLNANWYYTWGTTTGLDPDAPKGIEFVPMFWSHTNVTQANIDVVNQMYRDGKIFFVLGFNEPDLTAESNMSVSQALDDWETLCNKLDPGIKLVSPAVSWPGAAWFDQFMQGVQQRNLRVDYIALHIYMGQSPSTYATQVSNIYNKYSKRVWITEFAPRDDNATSGHPETNHYSSDWILANFMPQVLNSYESMDAVFRYSWFSGSPTMAGLWTSMLVDKNGAPTNLGNYYKTVGQ